MSALKIDENERSHSAYRKIASKFRPDMVLLPPIETKLKESKSTSVIRKRRKVKIPKKENPYKDTEQTTVVVTEVD